MPDTANRKAVKCAAQANWIDRFGCVMYRCRCGVSTANAGGRCTPCINVGNTLTRGSADEEHEVDVPHGDCRRISRSVIDGRSRRAFLPRK